MPIAIPLAVAGAGAAGYAALGAGAAATIGTAGVAGLESSALGTLAATDTTGLLASSGASALTAADFAAGASLGGAATTGLTGIQELSLGSSLASAGGQVLNGLAAGKTANYNAAVASNNAILEKQNAAAAIQEGEANAAAASKASAAKVGGILANQGASGVDVNSGSSVDTRASAADVGQLSAINIRSQAARQAYGFESGSTNATAESKMYSSEATTAPIAGAVSAAGTLLSGTSNPVTSPWADYLANGSLGN